MKGVLYDRPTGEKSNQRNVLRAGLDRLPDLYPGSVHRGIMAAEGKIMNKTKIQWTQIPGYEGGTWNCWQGCTKVSEGCAYCYMYSEKKRYGQDPTVVKHSAPATFNLPLKTKEPHAYFTCSWSDFFHPIADEWRTEAWQIMRQSPHLFLVLTKRPERMAECLPPDWGKGYDNVWMGVTAENQARADERIPVLLRTPAKLRFVSCGPLLGQINIQGYLLSGWHKFTPFLHWVLAEGESGTNAREMDLGWLEFLRYQCEVAGTKFFVKQLGSVWAKENGMKDAKGGDMSEWPEVFRIREFPEAERAA